MKFSRLTAYLERLEKTSSRNDITQILSELFKEVGVEEIDKATYLLLGRVAPNYANVVFNIAERMMLSAISKAYKLDKEYVKKEYKRVGDLGKVTFNLYSGKDKEPSTAYVFNKLTEIAQEEGGGSQDKKISKMALLLSSTDRLSAKYLTRIPIGKLRLGFSDKTVLDALSWMEKGDKSAREELSRAYSVLPDVGSLAKQVKKEGVREATLRVKPKVGIPILPMLAQRLKSPSEMIGKMHKVSVEPKFDGLRIQIHIKKGKGAFVKAYTRNLNETSWMFPELQKAAGQVKVKSSVVLDSEAIGVDEERKSLANFQATMTRRRKHEVEKTASRLPIKFYVFDTLLVDEESYLDKNYMERREKLEKVVINDDVLEIVKNKITESPEDIEKLVEMEISEGLEGVMVKRVDSKYVSGRTGWRWVKMKEEEGSKTKLADTLDCIVMGYYLGRGKRAQFGIGGFLVGVPKAGRILTVTKIGTGLTDDQFKSLKAKLSKVEVGEKPKFFGKVDKDLVPDSWVEPELVVEIAADEITKSPKHSSGYALRFPRLVRIREDKGANSATSLKELKKMFSMQ